MVIAVQHIALNCRDIKRQERFYRRHFGFQRSRVFNAGTPDEFIMLRLGATCLELFSVPGPARSQVGGEQAVGFKHLAFEVPDLDATLAGLHDDGVETEQIIDCSGIAPGFRICFFNDPDGNRLELMQGYQDQHDASRVAVNGSNATTATSGGPALTAGVGRKSPGGNAPC